jgi:hypothetical protein
VAGNSQLYFSTRTGMVRVQAGRPQLPGLRYSTVDSSEEETYATKQEGNTETQISRDEEG